MTPLEGVGGNPTPDSLDDFNRYKLLILHQLEANAKGLADFKKDLAEEADRERKEKAERDREIDEKLGNMARCIQEVKALLTCDDGRSVTAVAAENSGRISRQEWKSSVLGVAGGSLPLLVAALIWWLTR